MIRMIVGRLHVGESNRTAIRYVISAMRPGVFQTLSKNERKNIMREIVKEHKANRELYNYVMG